MKNLLLLLTLVISINLLSQTQKEIDSYYEEICLNTEWSGKLKTPRKYKEDVYIHFQSTEEDSILFYSELVNIINELNNLITTINISITEDRLFSNLEVYLGGEEGWLQSIKPYTSNLDRKRELLKTNKGLTSVRATKTEIITAYAFINSENLIDSEGNKKIESIKHLMWEEITQSFGLLNDSYTYPESIFYQKWYENTLGYCDIDKEIIKKLYNN